MGKRMVVNSKIRSVITFNLPTELAQMVYDYRVKSGLNLSEIGTLAIQRFFKEKNRKRK